MSVDKGKGPIFDPGLCRCCGSMKRCRVLNEEYQCNGQKEVYSDIIIDCFGIMLSHLDAKPSVRLVCATCVSRLREAAAFRAQVLRCEATFLQLRRIDEEAEDNQARLEASAKLEIEIKIEPSDKVSIDSPIPDDLPGDPHDPDDLGDLPDDPSNPTDVLNEIKQSNSSAEPERPKAESNAEDSDDAPLRPRRRRAPRPPPPPGKEKTQERKMSPEEEAEQKHRANIKNILEFSNATPIRCFSGVGYKCCYCIDMNSDPKHLKIHTLTKHDVGIRLTLMERNHLSGFLVKLDITGLKCQICSNDIQSIEDLMKHLINKHEKKLHLDINSHILPFKFDDGLNCAICSKIFTKFKSLQEHMNLHFRNYICSICDLGYPNKRMLGQHFSMHKTGVFQCAHCPKTFNTDQKKKQHQRRVHVYGASKFLNKCGVCQDRFKCYTAKEQHMLKRHGLSSEVKCQACEKTFQNKRYMTIHMQRDHLMRRPHKCPTCDKSFFERQKLRNHLVKHTGVREFHCDVCSKSYGMKRTLREHMRIHEADRRFKCQYCGLAFVQKCSWRGHMRSKHSDVFVE